jgi:xanthine dehydrogenase accessory factor
MLFERTPVLIRGAGEQASAVAWHLHRMGFPLVMTELPEPLAIRRLVSFAQAVRAGEWSVEGITARLCGEPPHLDHHGDPGDAPVDCNGKDCSQRLKQIWKQGEIALCIDAGLGTLEQMDFFAIVDGRMLKHCDGIIKGKVPYTVGIGPGFVAGEHVDVIVESLRGHELGRIITEGEAAPNTGEPGEIAGETVNRVHHAPSDGRFFAHVQMGDMLRKGDLIGFFEGDREEPYTITSKIPGRVRGLIWDGENLAKGTKLADVDPRGEKIDPTTLSEKNRCIAAGVMTALLAALGEHCSPLEMR